MENSKGTTVGAPGKSKEYWEFEYRPSNSINVTRMEKMKEVEKKIWDFKFYYTFILIMVVHNWSLESNMG